MILNAAVGAIKPRNVHGGISNKAIFRKGQETPQPNMATASRPIAFGGSATVRSNKFIDEF